MFAKILVAIDQSSLGDHVFSKALSLAKELKSELMLLHVLSSDEEGSPQLSLSPSVGTSLPLDSAALELYREQWTHYEQAGIAFLQTHVKAATSAGVKAEFTQTPGHPGRAICHLAKTWGADLIVVGRRGRTGLSELFLGSVSNYVVHYAPCEVLTIHTHHPSEN
ncbi:MAG: universal stress protein [Cyanobacteria bacterium CRU_2_1]|nr:universal stress protein [Cyanobacteria bacterium RU_5_0]NJR59780.1 universal stress protein [Cyanobacteria bacterium CRU_2_1]